MTTTSYLDGEVRIAHGYVFVTSRVVDSVARAQQITGVVDQALQDHELRAVIIDSREVEDPGPEVNAFFTSWVDALTHHDCVAVLVRSDLKRIASNMRALSVGVKMRSFHDRDEAVAWLRKPVPGRARSRPKPSDEDGVVGPRDRTITEPMDLPPPRIPSPSRRSEPAASAGSNEQEHPAKRRWRSPLLQGLNED